MQIVIDIPEELKNKIDKANEDNFRTYIWFFDTTLYCAIKEGTPLPKGHGRLIDVDALNFDEIDNANYGSNYIRIAPTIVEADKEREVSDADSN